MVVGQDIIEFLKEIEQFKRCVRTCRTSNNARAESDAEHSWHLATTLMLLEPQFPELDFHKVIKLALVHDLPEIYAGDSNPYRDDTQNKEEREREAAHKLFGLLPNNLNGMLLSLFTEYLEQQTDEACLVKSVDKLMPLIQNLVTNKTYSSYRHIDVTYEEAREYLSQYFEIGNPLREWFELLIKEAKEEGVFA